MAKKIIYTFCLILFMVLPVQAQKIHKSWQKQEVNLNAPDNRQIKAIYTRPQLDQPVRSATAADSFFSRIIDSPPIGGFVPWVAVSLTDRRGNEDTYTASPHSLAVGNFLTNDPNHHFAIGLFDTGASITLIDYDAATFMGANHSHITPAVITIGGANNSVDVSTSYPLGLFIQSLSNLQPAENNAPAGVNHRLTNPRNAVGLSNCSIAIGPEEAELPVAIGIPVAVYFNTFFNNRKQIEIEHLGQQYSGPEVIPVQSNFSPLLPNYPNTMPLTLKPGGGNGVYYTLDTEGMFEDPMEFRPGIPSTISLYGLVPTQSLMFMPGVDLKNKGEVAYNYQGFMFDTGAQVTVVSNILAARLGFNQNDYNDPANPDYFDVEISDASGTTTLIPGFYIDSIDIITLSGKLQFTRVPVIKLDINSPEGGTLDGIIGMNLFNEYNFVVHGGKFNQSPYMTYIRNIPGDIAPQLGDGKVDIKDLAMLAGYWLTTQADEDFNSACDINNDGIVNLQDLLVILNHWGL